MSIRIKQLVKNRQLAFTQGDLVKWCFLRNKVQITKAKINIYKNSICSLKNSQPAKWHRHIQNICHLKPKPSTIPGAETNPSETAEAINRHFATICNQLPALAPQNHPVYLPAEAPPPRIYHGQVQKALKSLQSSKAGHPSDLPIRLIKEFAPEFATPFTHV